MTIEYSNDFWKQFDKLPRKKRIAASKAIDVFTEDLETGTSTPSLRRHALTGAWVGYFSISAGGDLRLNYKQDGESIVFVAVGSHSQLYG